MHPSGLSDTRQYRIASLVTQLIQSLCVCMMWPLDYPFDWERRGTNVASKPVSPSGIDGTREGDGTRGGGGDRAAADAGVKEYMNEVKVLRAEASASYVQLARSCPAIVSYSLAAIIDIISLGTVLVACLFT